MHTPIVSFIDFDAAFSYCWWSSQTSCANTWVCNKRIIGAVAK